MQDTWVLKENSDVFFRGSVVENLTSLKKKKKRDFFCIVKQEDLLESGESHYDLLVIKAGLPCSCKHYLLFMPIHNCILMQQTCSKVVGVPSQ